jgi:uncharacterized membrane protein
MSKKKGFLIVLLAASVILFLKLIVSYNVYGTNDISSWREYADIIDKSGTFRIYSLNSYYNHPPLISWVLKFVKLLEIKTNLPFPYLFRLFPIFADYLSVFLIWELFANYKILRRTLLSVICAINPINFLISAFHGNTDTIFIFFVLLAIYFIKKDNVIASGLAYGLSVCIKIVPLILAFIFIFYIKGRYKKIIFSLSFLTIVLTIFSPYLINAGHSFISNVFLYTSFPGMWGVCGILKAVFNKNAFIIALFHKIYRFCGLYVILIFLMAMLVLSSKALINKKLDLIEGVFLIFCLFLAVVPGFGVQYLSWLSFFSVMVLPVLGVIYLLVGGFFLCWVYAYWGGFRPPYHAVAKPLTGAPEILSIVLWLIVVTMLIVFLSRVNRRRGCLLEECP